MISQAVLHTLPLTDDDSALIRLGVIVKSLPIPGVISFVVLLMRWSANMQLLLFWAISVAALRDKIPCQERGQAVQL